MGEADVGFGAGVFGESIWVDETGSSSCCWMRCWNSAIMASRDSSPSVKSRVAMLVLVVLRMSVLVVFVADIMSG